MRVTTPVPNKEYVMRERKRSSTIVETARAIKVRLKYARSPVFLPLAPKKFCVLLVPENTKAKIKARTKSRKITIVFLGIRTESLFRIQIIEPSEPKPPIDKISNLMTFIGS
jgi:hypothetical protein